MHEVSLMQSVLEIAEEQARGQGATRIHAITLRIGRLAGVEPEALGLAFEVASGGTLAEGASLQVETVGVVCRCPGCEEEFSPPDFLFLCPRCGRPSGDVLHGQEMELASLEVS